MSIVRYVNKKTGKVALYESTSYYDPETKQSRPKRKYLGTEDPETGELIPTSGKRGRKKKDGESPAKKLIQEEHYKEKYDNLQKELKEKDMRIRRLEHDNKRYRFALKNLNDMISNILADE